MRRYITSLVVAAGLLTGCGQVSDDDVQAQPKGQSHAVHQSANPVTMAGHIAGARASALLGDQQATREHVEAIHKDMMRNMRVPDATRPIEREPALTIIRNLEGVVSTIWVDRGNVLVRVDNASYRTMDTIDRVCAALEPLGDTLAVVVHVQNAHAKTIEASESISRNCQLPPGENALMQVRRRIDAVDPDLRRAFEAQQSDAQH